MSAPADARPSPDSTAGADSPALVAAMRALQTRIQALEGDNKSLRGELAARGAECEGLRSELQAASQREVAVAASVERLSAENAELMRRMQAARGYASQKLLLGQHLVRMKRSLSAKDMTVRELEAKLRDAVSANDQLRRESRVWAEQCEEERAARIAARERMSELETCVQSVANINTALKKQILKKRSTKTKRTSASGSTRRWAVSPVRRRKPARNVKSSSRTRAKSKPKRKTRPRSASRKRASSRTAPSRTSPDPLRRLGVLETSTSSPLRLASLGGSFSRESSELHGVLSDVIGSLEKDLQEANETYAEILASAGPDDLRSRDLKTLVRSLEEQTWRVNALKFFASSASRQ